MNAYTAITGGLSFTPQYDDNGNMLNDDKHTYTYDFNNKLVSVDETIGTYKYDALGRRIAKLRAAREGQPEQHTLFYYVGDQMVEEVTDGVTTSYLYGNNIDEALQMKREENVYYYHTNHLGSAITLTTSKGNIIESIEYDAYGMPQFYDSTNKMIEKSLVNNHILFAGRDFFDDIEYYDCRSRLFSTCTGRFNQKDLWLYAGGMNDYLYTNNSPVVFLDAFGHKRNPVVDFLFGGCLDLPKNWKCAENGWQKAGAVALCGLDVAGFIPGAGTAAKGASAAAKGGKMLKGANKLGNAAKKASKGKNPFDPDMLSRQLNNTKNPKPTSPKSPTPKEQTFNPDDFKVDYSKPNIFENSNKQTFNPDDYKVDYSKPNIFENTNKIDGSSQKAYEQTVNQMKDTPHNFDMKF